MSATLIILLWLGATGAAFLLARRAAERSAGLRRGGGVVTSPFDTREGLGAPRRSPGPTDSNTPRETASEPRRRQRDRAPARPRPASPRVRINSADAEELCTLPGVGRRAAERIVRHRDRVGGFDSLDDLRAVEGFTRDRVRRLAEKATL